MLGTRQDRHISGSKKQPQIVKLKKVFQISFHEFVLECKYFGSFGKTSLNFRFNENAKMHTSLLPYYKWRPILRSNLLKEKLFEWLGLTYIVVGSNYHQIDGNNYHHCPV